MAGVRQLIKHSIEAYVPPRWSIRRTWSGERVSQSGKLCLFAHWDPDGIVDDYVLHALDRWSELGFNIILISTSPKLVANSVKQVRQRVAKLMWRHNYGLDFASWRAAWAGRESICGDVNALVLTNDSVFGPFFSLEDWLQRVSSRSLTGFTESFERHHHLQSYFLYLSAPILRSNEFMKFWDEIRILFNKEEIIDRYEIGVSRRLASYDLHPLIAFQELLAHIQREDFQYSRLEPSQLNPTLHMWDTLIKEFDFPYLKTELLKRNRLDSREITRWRDYLPKDSSSLAQMIERHVDRVTRGKSTLL